MANTFVRSGYILAILFAIVVAATGNLLSLSCIIGSIVQVIELIKIKDFRTLYYDTNKPIWLPGNRLYPKPQLNGEQVDHSILHSALSLTGGRPKTFH